MPEALQGVSSLPSGADIFEGDVQIGKTPMAIALSRGKLHPLTFRLQGYGAVLGLFGLSFITVALAGLIWLLFLRKKQLVAALAMGSWLTPSPVFAGPSVPACIQVISTARYAAYGYDHVVTIDPLGAQVLL